MIDRYARPEMRHIWSLENQYQSWLDVEIAVTAGWVAEGHVPEADLAAIRANARFDVTRIAEIEETTRHDMVAFTRNVSESLGEERKWIHYGLTSTDVVDTAQALRLRQANDVIKADLVAYRDILGELALRYKDTVMMGRTHGVHAEPTTFGLKMARFYQAAKRDIDRFERVAELVETGKLSGAVGTFANVPPTVEEVAMNELGLTPQPVGSQVLPRDLHADYMTTIALIGTTLEEVATEIRGLQRSEIHEVEEGFKGGQKGSSAMPHKRNPIGSENIVGLSRVLRGYSVTALEDVTLWHERDISHSSAERIILADGTTVLDYMLHRLTGILANLQVFPETMKTNMTRTYGLIYSQRLLLKLVDAGMSREAAYDTVQPLTAKSWDEQKQFRDLVDADPTIQSKLTAAEVDDAFDYHWHLKHVDDIFKRVGLL
ncbi:MULTISPECIES: adenylosuccinate lyase [Weissella]|jgi:adenylosuccinate lyase|uniref:Adenylosuccinate lyase n=1 Tax=Weissella cibaria TaxID=137591 RepID=A0A0D1LKT9_9LACO|nr:MULTISPECIES: adenylosuccinate lyase [Weissella]APS27925.1 Adenylosuccinate lyase [Weissella cibaria]APU63324.1 Adenylosuccinate lyase [Weissella cibaria]APU65474.1 Adenylosuccinate lyase [Weissella cibaria]ASS51149.1 Adenylosuccinate lyase [Weissella cibaria]KIU19262.1 Adenylosuccinate lyase [Weissella cibaria]